MPSTFKKHPFAQRREKLVDSISEMGANSILVTDEINVRYLTGFSGDSSWLILSRSNAVLLSDTRYTTQIEEECSGIDVDIRDASKSIGDALAQLVKDARFNSMAIESDSISKLQFDQLAASNPNVDLVDTSGLIGGQRAIKDESEIQLIQRSIEIAEQTFSEFRAQLSSQTTERQLGYDIEHHIRKLGGESCSFDPIVGVGPRSALPHAIKSERTLGSDSFVLIDWGAKFNGYMSDLTRILVTGKISPKVQTIYGVVLSAQLAAIDQIRPGASMKKVDATARELIDREGFGNNFGHGLGHGFGLEIHEQPRLSPIGDGVLKPGMVVTVEPGIYLPGIGGVRIEDDVLVTEDGHRVLSSLSKDFESCFVEFN